MPPVHASSSIIDAGSGAPVVFIHAFPMNRDMWLPQVERLSHTRRVVAYDQPGFGRADPIYGTASMQRSAGEFAALLDALGIDRCVIGGCSMGGYIAMAALRMHPDRIVGAILSDTRAGADSDEGRRSRLAQAAETRAGGTRAVIDALLPKMLSPDTLRTRPDMQARLRTMMETATPEGIAQMLEAMAARQDSSDVLRGTDVPVCVMVGEHDVLTPPSEAEHLSSLARSSRLHVIPSAGHMSNLEAPDVFNGIVEGFLDDIGWA